MSLPAGQQRTLDAMAEGLCLSEPKLASMFAIFTRLSKNEVAPRREQLSAEPGLHGWLSRISARFWSRLPGGQTEPGRRAWRRALVLGQLAIAAVLTVVFVALNAHSAGRCPTSTPTHADVPTRPACPALNGPGLTSLPR